MIPYDRNTAILPILFRRPDTTQKVFDRIRMVKPKRLYIAADGPRNETERKDREAVRLYQERNLGCDIHCHQAINIFDFGKISILPNGDVYSNVNYPALGNICKHTIDDIIRKEIKDGHSWFRVRTEAPCINCAYQWFCPSPSDYEILIGKPNLGHINKIK